MTHHTTTIKTTDKVTSAPTAGGTLDYPLPFFALVFFTFLIYITPQAYIPTLQPLHLPRVTAIFAVVLYVLSTLKKRQSIIRFEAETRLVLILILLAVISIPFSIWPGGSLNTFTNLYLKVIIIFFLIPHVVTSLHRFKQMIWSIIFFCLFLTLIAVRDFLEGKFLHGRIAGAGLSIAANPNDLALTLNLAIPFALSYLSIYKKGLKKGVCALFLFLVTGGVICTFSRGGFVTLTIIFGIFFLKIAKRRGAKVLLPPFVLVILIFSILPTGYTDRMSSILDFSKDTSGSAQLRTASAIKGFELMLDNPVLGVGLGQNILALNEKGLSWEQIHNVYLEIGSELGITPMVIFIVLLYKLIKNMRLIQKDSVRFEGKQEVVLLAQAIEISLIGFAVAAMFHPVAYHFYFYYIAGFAVAIKRVQEVQTCPTEPLLSPAY